MTGKGGDLLWSRMTGMRPLGSMRRNQSFFCSLVLMLLTKRESVSGCRRVICVIRSMVKNRTGERGEVRVNEGLTI